MDHVSDFLIATAEELQAFKSPGGPTAIPPMVLGHDVQVEDVARLLSILDGTLAEARHNEVAPPGPLENQMFYTLPEEAVGALARAEPERLGFWGKAWVSSSPPRADRFTPERVDHLMQGLGTLARQALETGRDMYFVYVELPQPLLPDERNAAQLGNVPVLSDFFVATDDELRDFEPGKQPRLSMPMIWGRLGHIDQLMELHDIVLGIWTPETAFMYDGGLETLPGKLVTDERAVSILTGVEDELVLSLCPRMVEALAEAEVRQLMEYALKWWSEPDWRKVRMNRDDMFGLLMELVTLARHAVRTDRRMYVWLCRWPGAGADAELEMA